MDLCPACGNYVDTSLATCIHCGASLVPERGGLLSRRWLIGGAAVVGAMAVASIALVVSRGREPGDESASASGGPMPTPATVRFGETSATLLGALRGSSFGAPLSLDPLADGRDWVVLTIRFVHDGTSTITLDSDNYRLVANEEYIKQAGSDTEPLAGRVGLTYMGSGLSEVEIEGPAIRDVVMVFKIDPAITDPSFFIDGTGVLIPVAPYQRADGTWTAIAPPPTPTPAPATSTPD